MENEHYISDKFTIDELLRRSWKHKYSAEFFKFFDFIARFNHYSRFNTMLIYLQNPNVDFFGSSSYWKKRNRTINEDAKPYLILAPMSPVIIAYDLMETIGKDSPEQFLRKGLGNNNPFGVEGTLDPKILPNTIRAVIGYGISVLHKPLSLFKAGQITRVPTGKLEIVLNESAQAEEIFSTLIHELAHLFLGHTCHKEIAVLNTDKKIKLPQRNKLSTATEELEAETVSFLICKKLGLETRAAAYMAAYIKSEKDLLNFSYETVIKTADKIEISFFKRTRLTVGPSQVLVGREP
jgi:hypothetical protein